MFSWSEGIIKCFIFYMISPRIDCLSHGVPRTLQGSISNEERKFKYAWLTLT